MQTSTRARAAKRTASRQGAAGGAAVEPAAPTTPDVAAAAVAIRAPAAAPEELAAVKPRAIARGPGLKIEIGHSMLYISRSHVQRLPWEPGEVLTHVQIALRELGRGKIEKPAQISLYPQRESLLTATAAFMPNVQACGLKWFGSFPNNQRVQLPQVSALIILSDPRSGFPIAVLDAMWLTAQRGPAVSAVAARLLARPGSTTCAIIGGGVQGRGHIPALIDALPALRTIRIFDIRHAQAVKASKGWRGQISRRVRVEPVESIDLAVRDADVIVSATSISEAPQPTVPMDWVRSGALILPLDLDAVFQPAVFERADRFYVDSLDDLKTLHEKGLFIKAMPAHVTGQLGHLVAGKIPGRSSDDERIVCLNVGVGCVDVVLARAIFEKACRLGIGQVLEL